MTDEKIAKINALYHKSKTEGLSEEEKALQQALREEYIASVRNNMKQTLEHVKIQRPDGSITPIKKVKNRNIQ